MSHHRKSKFELVPSIYVLPEDMPRKDAEEAASQALDFAALPKMSETMSQTTRHREGITQLVMVTDRSDPDYDGEWLPEVISSAEDSLTAFAIARVINDRLLNSRLKRLRLHSVILNITEPGAEFGPHYDGVAGIYKSLALTPAILRAHADNHDVIAETQLSPGDQVMFENRQDPLSRPIHSIVALEDTPRISVVSRYFSVAGLAAFRQTVAEVGVEVYDEQQFQPRS